MPLTRYLADLLYARDFEMYLPTYVGALILIGVVQFLIGAPVIYLLSDWSELYKLHTLILYLVVSFVWVAMIFVSTVKDFRSISIAYVIGGIISILGSKFLGDARGLDGFMMGFTAGQIFIFLFLSMRVAVEFPTPKGVSFEFVRHFRTYPSLVLIGFLYNLAIWIDKFSFWFSPIGEHVDGFLYTCYLYDVPMYLTVVPAMSLFLIRIETSFYQYYKDYYGAVVGKKGLRVIKQQKADLVDSMKLSISRLMKIQGTISLLALLAVPYLIKPLGLNWLHLSVLRIGILQKKVI